MNESLHEHVRWCKLRAREFLAAGDAQQAVMSMVSDLGKHEEAKTLIRDMEAIILFSTRDLTEARMFVEGFPDGGS
jgi:hypothetical protein